MLEAGQSAGTACFLLSSLLPSACGDVLAPRPCSSLCSLRIQAVTAGEAAGRSWNAVLQLGALQRCLLHIQRPALLCQPGHLCMPPAVPSEQLCHPWRGWGVVALQALGLLRSSVPGTTCSLTARGEMCSASATGKHSTQSSFTHASDVPRGAVWAEALQCCVPTPGLQRWQCLSTRKFGDTQCLLPSLLLPWLLLLHLWGRTQGCVGPAPSAGCKT